MTDPLTLPTPPALPPDHCDVLVVGAGPAGSACAQWLARAGWQVVLVDQQVFPRDKVCGDGLIPDAHHALRRLGVLDEVMAQAQDASHVACIGARGGRVDVPGQLAVLPRRLLDDILKRAAERAGASFYAPWRFEAPLREADRADGRVVGALLQSPGRAGPPHAVRARWVVLATGAVPMAMVAAGLCERQVPSAMALRGYVRHPDLAQRLKALEVVWHPRLSKGYGWIFPCRDGVFNIGVGLAQSHSAAPDAASTTAAKGPARGPTPGPSRGRRRDVNLRQMFATFGEVYAPAAELLAGGEWVGPLKGAPLRCSLDGARFSQPGMLATGEAVGSTYAFTGEGIGKAMESGLLAAEALLACTPPAGARPLRAGAAAEVDAATDSAVRSRYAQDLLALKPRYAMYERANRVNEFPWLADLLIWRANRSPRILQRMAGVLDESDNPGRLMSLRGLAKLLLPIT